MKRLTLPLLVMAAACWLAPARAQTTVPVYVFVAVDAVAIQGNRITVTGILEGEAAPVDRFVAWGSSIDFATLVQNCEKLALLAMSRPGQHRLELKPDSYMPTCKLSRVTP